MKRVIKLKNNHVKVSNHYLTNVESVVEAVKELLMCTAPSDKQKRMAYLAEKMRELDPSIKIYDTFNNTRSKTKPTLDILDRVHK